MVIGLAEVMAESMVACAPLGCFDGRENGCKLGWVVVGARRNGVVVWSLTQLCADGDYIGCMYLRRLYPSFGRIGSCLVQHTVIAGRIGYVDRRSFDVQWFLD